MSPSIQTDAYTSGRALWNEAKHKRGELVGLKVDNRSAYVEELDLYDGFTTTASKTMAAGATQASEDLGATDVLSGKIRARITVPAGEFHSLGQEDLKEVAFLGKAWVVASTTTADCIIIAQYRPV